MDTYIPTETGHWVSEKFMRLSEIIKDYDANLELRWIPPDKRTRDDKKPYCIVDTSTNYIVRFHSELDSPEDVLEALFLGDTAKGDVLARLDARNAANEAMRMKAIMDKYDEANDFAEFLVRTNKNYIKTRNPITGEKLKLDDELRRI